MLIISVLAFGYLGFFVMKYKLKEDPLFKLDAESLLGRLKVDLKELESVQDDNMFHYTMKRTWNVVALATVFPLVSVVWLLWQTLQAVHTGITSVSNYLSSKPWTR